MCIRDRSTAVQVTAWPPICWNHDTPLTSARFEVGRRSSGRGVPQRRTTGWPPPSAVGGPATGGTTGRAPVLAAPQLVVRAEAITSAPATGRRPGDRARGWLRGARLGR